MFRDDAFKFLLSACFEQSVAIAIELIAKLTCGFGSLIASLSRGTFKIERRSMSVSCRMSFPSRCRSKSIKDDAVRLPPHRRA